jgi:L-rhamnose mutarotase
MRRYGSVIRLRPEKYEEYKKLHAAAWPGVLAMIHQCGIRNYTIYHKDGFLFSHFEYVGEDYDADMAKLAADPLTQEWWTHCMPCQEPLETRQPGEWWASMEEMFHCD